MIKIGIIGLGRWGRNHLRILSETNCELIGFADIDETKERLAKKYGTKFFLDYKKMLPEVDAVTVVAPTDKHYEIVKNCLEAKKHVLVEKPITLNSKEAKELVSLAKKSGLILSVGYLYRFNAAVKQLKKIIKEIGKIQYITARYIHSTHPPRKDCGAIFNLGIHLIDILNFVLEKMPKKVFAKKNNLLNKHLEDSANITLDYGSFVATLELSSCHPLKKRDMWIIASKKKVYADFLEQIIKVYPLTVSFEKVITKKEKNIELRKNEPLKEELKHFCECVENKKTDNLGKEEYYTTKVCELSLESAESGEEKLLNTK